MLFMDKSPTGTLHDLLNCYKKVSVRAEECFAFAPVCS